MNHKTQRFRLIAGVAAFVATVLIMMSGGKLGGKKTIDGDKDLPPIANAEP